jgi:hypothetical protein
LNWPAGEAKSYWVRATTIAFLLDSQAFAASRQTHANRDAREKAARNACLTGDDTSGVSILGDGTKDSGLGLSFGEPVSIKVEGGSSQQGEQEAHDSLEHPSLILPPSLGIECVVQVLVDRVGGYHGPEAASSPAMISRLPKLRTKSSECLRSQPGGLKPTTQHLDEVNDSNGGLLKC